MWFMAKIDLVGGKWYSESKIDRKSTVHSSLPYCVFFNLEVKQLRLTSVVALAFVAVIIRWCCV